MQIKAKTARLYIACDQSAEFANYATELVNQLEPTLFYNLGTLCAELGEEMTPILEKITVITTVIITACDRINFSHRNVLS